MGQLAGRVRRRHGGVGFDTDRDDGSGVEEQRLTPILGVGGLVYISMKCAFSRICGAAAVWLQSSFRA